MTELATQGLESPADGDSTDLDPRDVRALCECMTVLPLGGDLFSVTTESGKEYHIDAREERCTCPDAEYNLPTDDGRETCKHVARVAYATGERSIPSWLSFAAVDPQLGLHVDSEPVVGGALADGGQVVEEPDTDDSEEFDVGCDDCVRRSDGTLTAPCFSCYRDDGVGFPN